MENWMAFGILTVNAVSDWRKREICLTPTAAACAGGIFWQIGWEKTAVFSLLLSLVPGFLLAGLAKMTENGIGMGDGIVMGAAGSWLGFYRSLGLLSSGLLLAAAVSVFLLIRKSRRKDIPFIPFLAVAFLMERIFETV